MTIIQTARHTIEAALAIALAACGGGGSSSSPPPVEQAAVAPAPIVATGVYVIGNSIAASSPNPAIGWTGNWGMAASAEDKDYAHLTAAALGLPVTVQNINLLERGGVYALPAVSATTILVVQLGDNATDLPGFTARYKAMLDTYSPARLACVSRYWAHAETDAMIKAQCEAHGGTYVYIGDIYPTRQDTGTFSNADVDGHPHDWSMAEIASRIATALR